MKASRPITNFPSLSSLRDRLASEELKDRKSEDENPEQDSQQDRELLALFRLVLTAGNFFGLSSTLGHRFTGGQG
jgi:hypothetical protein